MPTGEEILAKRERMRKALRGFFSGSSGKEVLAALEDEIDFLPLNTTDTHETYFRLGKMEAFNIFKKLGDL